MTHDTHPLDLSSIPDIVCVFSGLPLLQRLQLGRVLPSLPPAVTSLPPVEVQVALPYLQSMNLLAPTLSCASFLDHFTLPTFTAITLVFIDVCPTISLPLLVAPLHSKLRQLQAAEARVIDETFLEFCLKTSGSHTASPVLSLRFLRSTALDNILGEICARLPLNTISSLSIQGCLYTDQTKSAWTKMFEALANVEILNLSNDRDTWPFASPNILSVLSAHSQQDSSSNVQPQLSLMSKLKRITLDGFKFSEAQKIPNSALVDRLCTMFRSREAAGCKVEEVVLQGCVEVREDDAVLLRQCVLVDWDGQ